MDAGCPGPLDPERQASQQGGQSSSPNGPFVEGVVRKQNPTGATSSRTVKKQNRTITAVSGSFESHRKPQRGKQKASSAAKSQQPGSTSAYEAGSMKATLPRPPRGMAKEMGPQLQQRKCEKDAADSSTSTGVAPESRHDDEDESRVSEPPQTISPAGDLPLPITPTKSMVWIDDGIAAGRFFGSLIGIPGVTVKVTMPPTKTGDPSILLSLRVNKYDLSKPISKVEAEVSRFELVLTPRILIKNRPREQHSFRYSSLQNNEGSLGEASAKIINITKGNLEHLVCIDTGMTSYRVLSPYEPQYWTRLRDSDLLAHRAVEAGTNCLDSLEQIEISNFHFKFWFRLPCVFSKLERIRASPPKRCVEELRRGTATSEEPKVTEPTLGESQSPGETVSDDRLAATTGSGFAPSPGRSRTSVLSVEQELEDRIAKLQNIAIDDKVRFQHLIRGLGREYGVLRAEAKASAAQQQRQAVALKLKDEQISELQAKNDRLDKRLELEREAVARQLEEYKDFVRSIRRISRYLPGISVEDKASESSHGWPAATPDRMVGESNQEPVSPSDQGIEVEPLDKPKGFPDERDFPDDEASEAAHDDDAANGINAFHEPATSSPPRMAGEDHEQFNTDWAAECHNLKKMKRSSKSKRKQQKKPTEKD